MAELKTIHEIRFLNAKRLMEESGLKRKEFAEKIDMSYSLLSQYLGKNPTKNIGDDTAIKIEDAFGKPRGYLDQSDLSSLTTQKNVDTVEFKKFDIEAFKKKYNIPDSEDAVKFVQTQVKPFPIQKRYVPVKAYSKMGMDGYFNDMGY
ncbi:helix-turn-helix domain-containing protein, partial [Acinetobacter oleivorans]